MKIVATLSALATAALLSFGTAVSANDWKPSGSLTLQVGFGAGGATDTIARVLGQTIEEQTGWNVIVENKPGGGGVAMFTSISKRPPRGNVIGMGVNMPILVNLVMRGEALGFDLDDFDYLATVSATPIALIAAKDAPFDDLEGMIAHAKESGPLSVAFDARPQKLLMDLASKASQAQFNMVSTGGGSEMIKLILGGQVQAAFGAGEHFPYLESGQMKVIASANAQRLNYAPDIKTFQESGVNGYVEPYFFIATTAGTPREATEALSKAIDNALKTDALKNIVANAVKTEPRNLGPEGTKDMLVNGIDNVKILFAE